MGTNEENEKKLKELLSKLLNVKEVQVIEVEIEDGNNKKETKEEYKPKHVKKSTSSKCEVIDDMLKDLARKEKEIVRYYGLVNQLKKFSEEQFELIYAIKDYIDNPTDVLYDVAQEIADVQVLVDQFMLDLGISQDYVNGIKLAKVNRQMDRIGREKDEECN